MSDPIKTSCCCPGSNVGATADTFVAYVNALSANDVKDGVASLTPCEVAKAESFFGKLLDRFDPKTGQCEASAYYRAVAYRRDYAPASWKKLDDRPGYYYTSGTSAVLATPVMAGISSVFQAWLEKAIEAK
jgi:hypothetical protein